MKSTRQIFAENLRYYMSKASKTQADLYKYMNVTSTTASQWYNGHKAPRLDKIEKICQWLGITKNDLLEERNHNEDEENRKYSVARIPVLGYVAAGIPIEEIEDIVDWEEIPKDWLRGGKKYFALRIRGDSMEPRMYDGDVVIVEKQDDAETGAYVIAAVNGDHATCKRLMKYRDSIALLSLNSKYDPMIFTNEEVRSKPVTILGVVREIRGKMKGM